MDFFRDINSQNYGNQNQKISPQDIKQMIEDIMPKQLIDEEKYKNI